MAFRHAGPDRRDHGRAGGFGRGLAQIAREFKRELAYYRRLMEHPGTPKVARWLLAIAVGYALMPFDLIPDFLPVIGHLDDLIVVPGLVLWAIKLVPPSVKAACREAEGSVEKPTVG